MDFRTNDRNYYYGILSVSQQSQSTDANTSTLAYSLTLYAGNTWFSGYTIGYRVKVDGAQVAYHDNYGNQTSMSRNSSKLVCSGATTVQHDDDGQKTVAVEAEIWTDSSSGLPVYLSCSGSMTLDQILRESSIAATDANIGATTMIVVARRKESYTHSIAFDFGSLSGYLLADGTISSLEAKLTATQIGWTLPASFYAQIPTAKFGTVRLTCRTYNGDKQVGTARTATFRAMAAEDDCAPTVSGTVEDTNAATIALTGDASKLVRFCSTALCTITAAARNGAALASKSIAGETVEGSSRAISAVELDSFVFAAADSRGYTTSLTVQAETVPYVKLTAYAEAERVDTASGKVRLTVSGSVFGGSFGATGNALTVKYRLDHAVGWTDIPASIADNAYTAEVMLYNVTYNAAHTLEVSVADKLTTVPLTGEIKRGIPVFDWGEHDIEVHVPVLSEGFDASWRTGRDQAIFRKTGTPTGPGWYYPLLSAKTVNGALALGVLGDDMYLSYVSDADYADETLTEPTAQYRLTAPDAVIEYGSDSRWTWRKWRSGIAECFGHQEDSGVSVTSAWGNLYDSTQEYGKIAYPSGLFAAEPVVNVTVRSVPNAVMMEWWSQGSKAETPIWLYVRPTPASDLTVTANIYAVGRWK